MNNYKEIYPGPPYYFYDPDVCKSFIGLMDDWKEDDRRHHLIKVWEYNLHTKWLEIEPGDGGETRKYSETIRRVKQISGDGTLTIAEEIPDDQLFDYCKKHNIPYSGSKPNIQERTFETSRGYTIFVKDNKVGGRSYWSDEIGGGVLVWDTCLVDVETLELSIQKEKEFAASERTD